jgi:hypothetical protein
MLRHLVEEGAEKEMTMEQYEIEEKMKRDEENRTEGQTKIMWHIF